MQLFDSDLGKYTYESCFKYQDDLWCVSYLLRLQHSRIPCTILDVYPVELWCLFWSRQEPFFCVNFLSIYSKYSVFRWFNVFPLILSSRRFSCCPGSSSAGATRGLVSRDTASSDKPPASQKLPLALLRPPQCAAVPALRCLTPAPAAPLQIWARPQRFVLLMHFLLIQAWRTLF